MALGMMEKAVTANKNVAAMRLRLNGTAEAPSPSPLQAEKAPGGTVPNGQSRPPGRMHISGPI
eukprot:6532562-Prymnesium_polylepis.1